MINCNFPFLILFDVCFDILITIIEEEINKFSLTRLRGFESDKHRAQSGMSQLPERWRRFTT